VILPETKRQGRWHVEELDSELSELKETERKFAKHTKPMQTFVHGIWLVTRTRRVEREKVRQAHLTYYKVTQALSVCKLHFESHI